MTQLVTSDPPEYRTSDRFRLHVTGITDLAMPFDGAIVLPRAPHPDDTGRLAAMRSLDHTDWLHYSYLYPRGPRSGESGRDILFPTLRDIEGKAFGLAATPRPVAGKVMVLVARGYTLLDDISVRAIFSEKDPFYSPRYPENASLSAIPGVIVLHLDTDAGDLILPSGAPNPGGQVVTAPPFPVASGFSPFTTDHGAYQHLKDALVGKVLKGEIYGFDIAGHAIDGYALALALGITPFTATTAGLPSLKEMLVQLVDAHGAPLDPAGTTLESLKFDPPLQPVTIGSAGGLRIATFPDETSRELRVSYLLEDAALDGVIPFGKFPYQFRHVRIGLWPGFGHQLKRVVAGAPTVLKLAEGFEGALLPPFVRLCVLHPGDEFQTTAGGQIKLKEAAAAPDDGQPIFQDNEFRLYTEQNTLAVFNTGADYFADLVTEAEDNILEKLEGLYITNWKSEPNVFLHGRMVAHGIERTDVKPAAIEAAIDALIQPGAVAVAGLDPVTGPLAALSEYILISRRQSDAATETFQLQIERHAEPGSAKPFVPIQRGFVRKGGPATWLLTGSATAPDPDFRLVATWKTSVGTVELLEGTRPLTATPLTLPAMPEAALSLGIDGSDPPRATLLQVKSLAAIAAEAGADPARDLRAIFLHLDSGRFEIVALDRTAPDAPNVPSATAPALLHSFERLFATDAMAVAIVDWPGSDAALDLRVHLKTRWRRIEYPLIAFQQGQLPLSIEELGGWLRTLIATRETLDLRALYWEHTQANLAPGPALDRGLANSAALTAVLNRSVAGKSALAIRDRSTRQLGAFHQKAVVLVKRNLNTFPDGHVRHRVVAYVGGIDLSHGRWDTDEHHHLDPERQDGAGWRDLQVKLEGDAALDVLKNFTQRWQTLIDFDASSPCKPVNVVNGMEKPFKVPTHVRAFDEPGPLVQVTRTWPPASCHASLPVKPFVAQTGELGTLDSYLKAIRRASKFILINDQYFFGVEIAQAIREALLRPGGPDHAVILLPMNLSEVEIVDPVIFKTRKRAIESLYYGASFEGPAPGRNQPHRYRVNPATGPSLRDRIAIVTPVNRRGDEIYVHSKTMVVDDVWMSIGSANFTFRGTTYEMEINAAVIDQTLQQGGGVAVREQRSELCRRMLGLPAAYGAMMQDWNACFHMFKALETETMPADPAAASSPGTLNLHPLPPMVKALPPGFAPKLGPEHQPYNEGLSFVLDLDNNMPGMLWLVRNALDVDGRDITTDQQLIGGAQLFTNLRYLSDDTAYLTEFPHNPPSPYGRITFDLNPVKPGIVAAIDGGDTLVLVVSVTLPQTSTEPEFQAELGRHKVTLDTSPRRAIVIAGMTASQLLVPLSVARSADITAELLAGGGAGARLGQGSHRFDPSAVGGGQPVTNGVFVAATIALAAG